MFKSFSGRFFTIYVVATLIMFLLLFSVISQVISSHFIGAKQQAMYEQSQIIASEYISMSTDDTLGPRTFSTLVNVLASQIDSRIIIVNEYARVLYDSSHDDSLVGSTLEVEMVTSALEGENIRTIGHFDNHYKDLQLLASLPIEYQGNIIGAVIMHAPHPRLDNELNYVYQLTIGAMLALILITSITIYLYSRNIARSIEAISDSAKSIANGDFSSRVIIHGNDEISRLSKSMNYMATELEKLEDMRKDFIANISHDFRSPLTSIKGFIQAMLDGTIPCDSQEKYLNIVLDETDRLTKLTNDILLLTKMENNTIRLEMQDFDLHDMIRKILLQFEQKILDKHIDFTLLIDRHELFVHADLNQIQRVITNLVDNAIKFCSPHDTIIVETTVIRHKVEVSVKDSGPGISEEDIKYIWDRFHKADRSRGKDKKGIGLGLSIVREIIKSHEEEINVYSQEGKGTTFVFTLPLV